MNLSQKARPDGRASLGKSYQSLYYSRIDYNSIVKGEDSLIVRKRVILCHLFCRISLREIKKSDINKGLSMNGLGTLVKIVTLIVFHYRP